MYYLYVHIVFILFSYYNKTVKIYNVIKIKNKGVKNNEYEG